MPQQQEVLAHTVGPLQEHHLISQEHVDIYLPRGTKVQELLQVEHYLVLTCNQYNSQLQVTNYILTKILCIAYSTAAL